MSRPLMTDIDLDSVERDFRTYPEVQAVCTELKAYKAAWSQADRMFRSHPEFCAAKGEQFRPCGKCTVDAIAAKHGLETEQAGEQQ